MENGQRADHRGRRGDVRAGERMKQPLAISHLREIGVPATGAGLDWPAGSLFTDSLQAVQWKSYRRRESDRLYFYEVA